MVKRHLHSNESVRLEKRLALSVDTFLREVLHIPVNNCVFQPIKENLEAWKNEIAYVHFPNLYCHFQFLFSESNL